MSKLYFKVASDWQEVVRLRTEISKLEAQIKSMDANKAPQAVAVLNNQMQQAKHQMNGMITEAAKAGAVMDNDFKSKIHQGSQSVNDFTQKIINQKNAIKGFEQDLRALQEEYRKIAKNGGKSQGGLDRIHRMKNIIAEEKDALFNLTQEQANARLSVKKLRDEYALYRDESKETIQSNEGVGISLKKAFAVIGGVAAGKELISNIIRVRGEFQAADTAIQTLLGSKEKANVLMSQVKEYAKISPLEFSDVTQATQMMLGFNIEAEKVPQYLRSIGDISMGETGKFNSLTLAFSQMSAAGKLMGQDLNQMINAGFNPLQQISDTTGKSIATLKDEMSKGAISAEMVQKAFIDATSAGGKFFGMSENASKTINGQLSMMQDAIDSTFNELGEKSEGAIMSGIQLTTKLVENYETVGKILSGLVITYGAYRTAVMLSTIATGKHTIAEVALTNVRVMARRAQMALNASMLANPYVLLAVAIGGLGTAMWAMSDSTNAAARAQKEYNEIKDNATQKEKEHKQKIEELLSAARDESLATLTRQKSLEELRKEYPKIFEQYDIEKLKLIDILELKRQINEEDSNRSVEGRKENYRSLKEKSSLLKEILGYNVNDKIDKDELTRRTGTRQRLNELYGYQISDIKQIQELYAEESTKLKLLQKDVLEDNLASYKAKLKDYSKAKLEAELKMAQSSASKRNGFNVGGMMVKSGDLKGVISSINGALSEKKAPSTYKKDYEKAQKDWEDAKKALSAIEKDKAKFSSKQYEEAKALKETTEKKYKDLGGITGSSLTKQDNQAEKFREQQEKYNLLLDKQKLEQIRAEEDLQMQVSQSKIDTMSDGFNKEQEQRDLNNKKEIQSLERQKDDYIRAIIQAEKDKFDAQEELKAKQNTKYQKKTFDSSSVSVDTSAFDGIISNTKRRQGNDQIAEQEADWNEYLIKYGTFQQKKEALARKYSKLIDEAETSGKAALLQQEFEEVSAGLDINKLKQDINWEVVFGDMSKTAKKELQAVKKQLQEFKKSPEFRNATPEQIKVIEDAINNINNALVDKGGFFGGLGDSLEEYRKTIDEVTKSQEDLNKALESGDKAAIEKAQVNLNNAKNKNTSAETNVDKSKDKAINNITSVANAMTQLGSAEFSLSSFGTAVGGLVDALSSSGSKIGGIIAAILSLLDEFGKDGGIEFGKNIVNNVISAIGGTIEVPFKMLGIDLGLGSADYDEYNALVAEYDGLLDVWDQLLDKKKSYIKESYGAEATKVGEEALRLLKSEKEITKELASSRLDAGKSAGSHSINYRMWKGSYDYDGTNWKDVAGDISKSLEGIDFSSMWSMLDMSAEQLEWIKTNYSGLWAHMDGDFKGYLDDIIEYGEVEKEIIASVKEQITGISLDSFQDSYTNMLSDMDSTNEDFADNFEEYLKKSILQSLIAKNYSSKIQDLYDSWATAGEDDVYTDDEINELRDKQQKITDEMLAEREELMKKMGWDSSSGSSQDSSQKGFATMSQDTGDELNGRFTALQISNEEIKNSMLSMLVSVNLLSVSVNSNGITLVEIRNLMISSNSYLEDIAKYTKELIGFKQIIHNIENSAKAMAGK